jgi:DNA repair protein RecO (recombination protein O)
MSTSKTKGKGKTSLPLMSVLEIVGGKKKGELLFVKEIELRDKNFELLSDMNKASMVMFLNEVLIKTIKDYDADPELFDFITNSLESLNNLSAHKVNFHLKFLLDLSHHLGFYPNGLQTDRNVFFDLHEGHFCEHQPIHKEFIPPELCAQFSQMLEWNISELGEIDLSNTQRRLLLGHFIDYFRIHVDKFDDLKSREILEAVLA